MGSGLQMTVSDYLNIYKRCGVCTVGGGGLTK